MREEVEEGREGTASTRLKRIWIREGPRKVTERTTDLAKDVDLALETRETFLGMEGEEVSKGEGSKLRRERGESVCRVADERTELKRPRVSFKAPPLPVVVI